MVITPHGNFIQRLLFHLFDQISARAWSIAVRWIERPSQMYMATAFAAAILAAQVTHDLGWWP